jgi:uncharacterized protein DUF2252
MNSTAQYVATTERRASRPPRGSAGLSHASVDERVARGKAARAEVPRSTHAGFEPAADRPDPVELLEQQAETRVPELVPIRYGRMLVSPFTFYRGAALIMASDLAATPVSGIEVQLCGDAHLSNFGLFGSPERRLVFDLNDFDETLPGPWEWDVKRLAASITVVGRALEFSAGQRATIVRETVAGYREAMRDFASKRNLEVFYARLNADELAVRFQGQLNKTMRKRLQKTLAKAQTSDSMKAFSKLTRDVDGAPRIISDPPLIQPIDELLPGEQGVALRRTCTSCCAPTARRWTRTGARRWRAFGSSTSRTRSSAWAASARVRGSRCCSDAMTATRCSCSSRRPRHRCWRSSSARALMPTTVSVSSPGSA